MAAVFVVIAAVGGASYGQTDRAVQSDVEWEFAAAAELQAALTGMVDRQMRTSTMSVSDGATLRESDDPFEIEQYATTKRNRLVSDVEAIQVVDS